MPWENSKTTVARPLRRRPGGRRCRSLAAKPLNGSYSRFLRHCMLKTLLYKKHLKGTVLSPRFRMISFSQVRGSHNARKIEMCRHNPYKDIWPFPVHGVLIRSAAGYTLYSSCEPCFMCSGATVWTKLGRLVCGASNRDLEHIFGKEGCDCSEMMFANSSHRPRVTDGVLCEAAKGILTGYFSQK